MRRHVPSEMSGPVVVQPAPLYAGASTTRPGVFGHRPQGFEAWQLLFGVKGRGQLLHAGGQHAIQPGELVLYGPGVEQHYGNPGPRLWTHFYFVFHAAPSWQRWLAWPEIAPGIGFLRPRGELPAIRAALRRCEGFARGMHRFGPELGMDCLHQALIHCQAEHLAIETQEADPRLIKWIEEVGTDLKKSHLPIREMALRVGMSPSQFARAFHRQFGLSPVRYFEKARLDQAANLLSGSTMRVREISEAMGYDDPLYFSVRFRAALGMSPRQYRQKQEKGVFSQASPRLPTISPATHFEEARLWEAAKLLRTSMPLQEVSASVGFQNLAKFSARFRAVIGSTPLEYRRQNRNEA